MRKWAVINRGIGHWPPSEMDAMSLEDFESWYTIAVENIQAEIDAINKVKNGSS
jgi:hypothetical protein